MCPEFDTFAENLFVKLITAILVFFIYVADSTGQIDSLKQRVTLLREILPASEVNRDGVTLPEVKLKK